MKLWKQAGMSCAKKKKLELKFSQKCLFALPIPVCMLSALVAQLDGQAASPTPAPSLAPRTETMTTAPANVPSLHLGVCTP